MPNHPVPVNKEPKHSEAKIPKVPNPYRPNIWYFLGKVTVSAISKGQILPFGFFCVIVFFIYRMSPADLYKLGLAIIGTFTSWWMLGWLLLIVTFMIGVIFRYKNRKNHESELKKKNNQIEILEGETLRLTKKLENKAKKL